MLESLIDMVAGLLETIGVSEADAQRYAAWIVYGSIALLVFIVAMWVIRLVRGSF